MDQLDSSDHRPIPTYIDIGTPEPSVSPLPRWNLKKANWKMFEHTTNQLTSNINAKSIKINSTAKYFTEVTIKAAIESRKNSQLYSTPEIDILEKELSQPSDTAEKYSLTHPEQYEAKGSYGKT